MFCQGSCGSLPGPIGHSLSFVWLSLLALGQALAGATDDVLDRLAVLPAHPHRDGRQRDQPGPVCDWRRLFAGRPAPVGELEKLAADHALGGFLGGVVPAVAGGM